MRCNARDCDFRTTRDLHRDDAQLELAEHALANAHWLCICCHQSLPPEDTQTCETCLTRSRELLAGIVLMWIELPQHRGLKGTSLDSSRGTGDGRPLPGGDALVLAGPGGTGQTGRRLTPGEIRDGLVQNLDGREHQADNRDTDPSSVAQTLTSWEDDWRHTREEDAAGMAAVSTARVVHAAAGYLEIHARWAAREHLAFDEYYADLKSLHERLERVTGRKSRTVKANASCFDCEQPLVKRDDELHGVEEHYTCTGCKRQYDDQAYQLALKAELYRACSFELDGVTYSTRELVAAAVHRSKNTIRVWENQQIVRTHIKAGIRFVCVQDAMDEDEKRPRRDRASA